MRTTAHYFDATDTLAIELADRPAADAEEIADDVLVEYDDRQNVVGIVIEHACEVLEPLLKGEKISRRGSRPSA